MAEEWIMSFVQSFRWILAGIAGVAFSEFDLLNEEKNLLYKATVLFPTIVVLAGFDFLIRWLLL